MTDIKIMTVNCQGLGGSEKRLDVLDYLKKKDYHIYCLQDTHFTREIEPYIQVQWGYRCLFNSFRGNARGVAVLINNNFEFKIHKVKHDKEGNLLIIDIDIEGERIILVNVYGPNGDNPQFYEHAFKQIEEFENEKILICGDFNLVIDQNLDTHNYKHLNNPKSRQIILDKIELYELKDPFRQLHPKLRRYSWRKKTPVNKLD